MNLPTFITYLLFTVVILVPLALGCFFLIGIALLTRATGIPDYLLEKLNNVFDGSKKL